MYQAETSSVGGATPTYITRPVPRSSAPEPGAGGICSNVAGYSNCAPTVMRRRSRTSLTIALLFAAITVSAAQVAQIDSPAAAGSLAPSIAPLADGRLVLSWLEPVEVGHALRFSVLDGDGFGPVGTIARGEDWFANWADTPGLFVLPGGDWVAHWLVKSGSSTYAYDVNVARSPDGGATWSAPIVPHLDDTPTEHGFVSYFAESDHAVGVVWLDGRRMHAASEGEGAMTLRTAVIGRDLGLGEQVLLDERVCDCCQTASARTASGPVVVYRGRSRGEVRDHFVVRRTASGWSEPERVHEDNWRIGGCPVNGPAIIADGERVAVAWFTMPEEAPRVHVAISRDGGKSFERIDTLGEGTALGRVDLALSERGFVLSWVDRAGSAAALELVDYDWRGRRLATAALDGLDAGRASGFPRLGVLRGCRPVIAWTGRKNDVQRVRVARIDADAGCEEGF